MKQHEGFKMTNMEFVDTSISAMDLRAEIEGSLVFPGDADYDAARQAWNLSVDQYPAVILIASSAADIAAGIRYARAQGLGVAIQSTGHGVMLPADDSLLIVTSGLSNVTVDVDNQTARVEAGVLWGAVLEKTHPFGLTPLLGSSSGVGAVGYTLGGGMGWLARKYGLAVDSVLEFEVVTADGQLRRVSETQNNELFWALRGGAKGALGVVTAMQVRLYPVITVYAGSVVYPFHDAKAVFRFYREWIQYLPAEWTTSISIMHLPPIPELPPFLRGQSVVMVTGCYAGDIREGQMMVQPLLDWKQPIISTFHPMPFSESDTISNDPLHPVAGRSSGAWLTDLSDETVDTLLKFTQPPALLKTEIRYAGGAIARVDDGTTAYSHRSETLLMQSVGMTPTPDAVKQYEAHMAAFKRALQPHLSGTVYMNFLEGEEARAETARAFDAQKFQRLSKLKAKYDPDNLFRFGFDIPVALEA